MEIGMGSDARSWIRLGVADGAAWLRSGVLQGHTFLLIVAFATMGVMSRFLWPRHEPRRYAGDVFAARYGCSLGYPLPRGRD